MFEHWILERPLQLAAHNILETVVRDDMVMTALALDRYCLLHKPPFLELVTVNEGSAEPSLLGRGEVLRKVGVNFAFEVYLA